MHVQLGGPDWKVKLGRRDSKTASLAAANSGVIPPPSSTLTNLIKRFQAHGLSARDMVALSGTTSFLTCLLLLTLSFFFLFFFSLSLPLESIEMTFLSKGGSECDVSPNT